MTLNLQLPAKNDTLKPTITVVGVGGAGGNAVNNMIAANLEGVNFVVANTDAQALDHTLANRAVQLGANITRGLGAGANPETGRAAAEEAASELASYIEGSNMVFITAGMGGGTGTGAAPVVARLAREMGILTVGVVTKPFQFEGTHRMRLADSGLKELQECVDTLIVIPNQNLFRIANERTTFADAFRLADEVLHSGVRGITDLMVKPGLINLDFADIRTVMREMGKAMMGTGEATGERRAREAAEAAISNPLLDDVSLKGARAALINITGGPDMTLFEVDEAANRIREEVDPEANIIFGSAFNEHMEGRVRVSVVATGIEAGAAKDRANMGPIEQKKPYLFNQPRVEQPRPDMARPPVNTLMPRQPAPQMDAPPAPAPRAMEPVRAPIPPQAAVSAPAPVQAAPQPAAPRLNVRPAMEAVREPQLEYAEAEAPQVAAPRQEPRVELGAQEEHSVRSLFSRLADVSRSLTPRHDAPARPEPARPEVVRQAVPLTEQSQLGDIDIPAFLRRQQ